MVDAPQPLADATTPNYGWTLPTVMADSNVWGGLLNGNLSAQDTTLFRIDTTASAAMPKSGGTFTGNVIAAGTYLAISGPTGVAKILYYETAGSLRWASYVTAAAEGGGNAGSDFAINRYTDTGASLDAPFTIQRSTGNVTVLHVLGVQGGLNVGGALAAFLAGATTTGTHNITGAPGSQRNLVYQTNGVPRWNVLADSSAESGSNVGSNFYIQRFNDAGTAIDNPFTISRSTGVVSMPNAVYTGLLTATGGLQVNNGQVNLNGAVATNRGIAWLTAGSPRWIAYADGEAESGGNAGTNFVIGCYTDTGAYNVNVMVLNRATGAVSMPGALDVTGALGVHTSATFYAGSPLNMTGAAGLARPINFQTSGVARWQLLTDASAEGPVNSNNGSNFYIARYNDAGTLIDSPIQIIRATGAVTIADGLAVAAGAATVPTPANIYDNTQNVATTAWATTRGMTAGPCQVQSGQNFYPNGTNTGRPIVCTVAGAVYLPGDANGSQATFIVCNQSTGTVGIAGAPLTNPLQPGEGVILVGNSAGGYYPVGIFRKASVELTASSQAEDYTITGDDGEVHFTADATVTIPDDLAHAVEVSCDPGVVVTFDYGGVMRTVPTNRTDQHTMTGPAEVTVRRKGAEIWLRGDVT
jgi:hypothetical protein